MDPAALQVLHHVLDARRRGDVEIASLPGADLCGAQLMRADLVGSDLSGAGLNHANLAGAKLGRAKLVGTLLRSADLAGADLTGADLRGADLSGARLEGASLADADLRGAALDEAVGEPATIAGAKIDLNTSERSGLYDADVIKLWRDGAVIDDLTDFEPSVRNACSQRSADLASDAGPSARSISTLEVEARRHRLKEDDELPPSARLTIESAQILVAKRDDSGDSIAPMSTRSLKLVAPELTPEMIASPGWGKGDIVLGVTLEKLLGQGNAGRVWQGTTAAGDQVAVKLFDSRRATVGLTLPSYRRGVSVMNRLTDADGPLEGMVRLRGVSLNQLGFAMDWAQNGSAVDLPALSWPVKSAVAFFEALCRAVACSHARGVLHRCLKPSNILLDDDLNPILADFDMVDLPTLAAQSREMGGYEPYAAPEELLGSGTQSPTADIYSLGRILHFLLAGQEPEEPVADVPKLDVLKNQPAGLTRIIRKCTMRAAEARYQGVDELLADVDSYEDYGAVGVGGGAAEANYLPYRVSSLQHTTPWLGSKRSGGEERPARDRSARRPSRRRRKRQEQEQREAAARSRQRDKTIGAVGAALLLASLLVVAFTSERVTGGMVNLMHLLSALAGALASFLIPPFQQRAALWRVLIALTVAAVLYAANLPVLFLPPGSPGGG
ncbi:MAG: hypothetical protein DRI90_06720 [Deltaproteobacteria bacterium]|nr:MAG: hypothetical protein DRI90_06720 [Deltaproteobacteria bacterium]